MSVTDHAGWPVPGRSEAIRLRSSRSPGCRCSSASRAEAELWTMLAIWLWSGSSPVPREQPEHAQHPLIGERISWLITARNSDRACAARSAASRANRNLAWFTARRDVGVGANQAAARQRHAADFEHRVVRSRSLVRLWLVQQGVHHPEAPHPGFDIAAIRTEFTALELPARDIVESRFVGHQRFRQAEQFKGLAIAHLHPVRGIDHHDAVAHVVQRHLQEVGFPGGGGFAGQQLLLRAVQPGLVDDDPRGDRQQKHGHDRRQDKIRCLAGAVGQQHFVFRDADADDQRIEAYPAIGVDAGDTIGFVRRFENPAGARRIRPSDGSPAIGPAPGRPPRPGRWRGRRRRGRRPARRRFCPGRPTGKTARNTAARATRRRCRRTPRPRSSACG